MRKTERSPALTSPKPNPSPFLSRVLTLFSWRPVLAILSFRMENPIRAPILLAEDNDDDVALIQFAFRKANVSRSGFAWTVCWANTGLGRKVCRDGSSLRTTWSDAERKRQTPKL
jgi:hypothetical protein